MEQVGETGEGLNPSNLSGRKRGLQHGKGAWIGAEGLGFQSQGHPHLQCGLA